MFSVPFHCARSSLFWDQKYSITIIFVTIWYYWCNFPAFNNLRRRDTRYKNPQLVTQQGQICCVTGGEPNCLGLNLLPWLEPRPTFPNKFLQPATSVFVARQVDHTRWKTGNIDQNLQRNNVARQVVPRIFRAVGNCDTLIILNLIDTYKGFRLYLHNWANLYAAHVLSSLIWHCSTWIQRNVKCVSF